MVKWYNGQKLSLPPIASMRSKLREGILTCHRHVFALPLRAKHIGEAVDGCNTTMKRRVLQHF